MRLVYLPLCALLLLAACGPREAPEPRIWDRQDLWTLTPKVETKPPDLPRQAWKRRISNLGPNEIRNPKRVPKWHFKTIKTMPASEVRALEQAAGSSLSWELDLGQEPYFSFIPLRDEKHPHPVEYRVRVRGAGGESQVHRSRAAQRGSPAAQATTYVDLADYAEQRITLVLEVLRPPEPRFEGSRIWAQWGSPAIYSRMPEQPRAADAEPEAQDPPPNVLILGVDTLRTDALGFYGAEPDVTPALNRLAQESDVWLEAVSCFNVTNPSFTSLLTGLYGKNHGIYNLNTPLPKEKVTLAEIFSEAGYETLAIIAARHLGPKASGLDQGFDEVVVSNRHFAAELGVDMAMDWIADREAPFFAWIHLFDPHTPHTPPSPFALGFHASEPKGLRPLNDWTLFRTPGPVVYANAMLGGQRDLYFGEVAYMDRQIDRLLDFMESRHLLENTILVLIADHGENFEDHGVLFGHHGLFETTTRVPLLIRWPGPRREGRRIPGLVQNVDVFPTVLAAAGLEAPESDGEDLRVLTGEGRRGRRVAFSEHAHQSGARVRTDRHSYMRSYGNPFFEDGRYLYDLEADPQELENLAGQGLAVEDELEQLLVRWLNQRREASEAIPADLTEEDIERLKALGYLQG